METKERRVEDGLSADDRVIQQLRNDCEDSAVELIERLQAENEALKKDAERYRWLRRPASFRGVFAVIAGKLGCKFPEQLDREIDDQMEKSETTHRMTTTNKER